MGVIELAPNPEGAQPCAIMQMNRKAIKNMPNWNQHEGSGQLRDRTCHHFYATQ